MSAAALANPLVARAHAPHPQDVTFDPVAPSVIVPSGAARLAAYVTPDREATPIVFLHAGVADSRMWRREFDALASTRRCVAFDRRGFGATPPAGARYDNVADTIAVMDAAHVPRAVLVGCSNGGRIALDAYLAHPERVAGLVLVCAAVGGAPEGDAWRTNPVMAAQYARWQEAERTEDRAALLRLVRHVWLDGPLEPEGRVAGPVRTLFDAMNTRALETAEDDTLAVFPDTAYAKLADVRVPALVVLGTVDVPDVTATMRHAAATIPGAALLEVRGAGHLPNLERPDLFLPRLERFVEAIG